MLPRETVKGAVGRMRIGLTPIARLWGGCLIALIAFFAVVNLPSAPRTWFDEGSHLHVPKTIVQHGVYADISATADGAIEYRYHGPTIGIGPTIMLPIALVYKLFGVSLLGGRIVIVAYLLVALSAFFLLARRLYGGWAALLALSLLIGSRTFSYEGMVEYGRQVLGEVPGIAFLILGMLAWLAALRANSLPSTAGRYQTIMAILSGLGFGFALVTKNQFVLIIPMTLFLVGILDWRYYRVGTWRLRLIPLLLAGTCFAFWTLAQFQFLGPGTFLENIQQTRQAAGGAIFVFSIRSTLRAGYYLLRPDLYGGLLIPALVYTAWTARQRNTHGLIDALLSILVGLWIGWYVLVSLGWPRYAFPAVAIGALMVARLIIDLIGWLRSGASNRRMASKLVALYTAAAVLVPITLTIRTVLSPDDTPQQFAAYLNANIPPETVIETWDPELGVLSDHHFKYPPQSLLDTAVRAQWLGGATPHYDWAGSAPPYVAVGPFGQYTTVYETSELGEHYMEVYRVGGYTLYRHR